MVQPSHSVRRSASAGKSPLSIFSHTYLRGNALRWNGFVLMFNHLCSNGGRVSVSNFNTTYSSHILSYPTAATEWKNANGILVEIEPYLCVNFHMSVWNGTVEWTTGMPHPLLRLC